MAELNNTISYQISVDTATGKVNIDGITKSFEKADKAFLKLNADMQKNSLKGTKAMKGLGDASGSATSSVMELSRVVSDAPYGIRGMANNITQLVSQMGTATVKAGGFGKALKEMGKMMMGPLGIVFAITVAVSALDFFKGGMEKASTAGTTFKNSIKDLADTFKNLQIQQSGVNDKINEYIDLSVKKAELDKVILKSTERLAEISELEDRTVKKRLQNEEELSGILSVRRRKILEQSVKVAKRKEEEYKTERRREIETSLVARQKLSDEIAGFNAAEAGTLKALKTKLKLLEVTRELVSKDADEYDRQTLAITAQKKLISDIEGIKAKGRKDAKKGKRDRVKALSTSGLKKDQDALMKIEKKLRLMMADSNLDKIVIEEEFHMKRLLKTNSANSALVKKWESHYEELKRIATEAMIGGTVELPQLTDILTPEQEEAIKEKQRLETQVRLEALMEASQAIGGFLDAESEREITRETNKTNKLNNELRERLNNEGLSVAARKSIQLEIARNDEALRVKQEAIEKKRFKTQKAINISQALISTYLAVAQVQANPLNLNAVTKGISMAATLAMGLSNVATLSRQQFQSSAGATATAGSLGGAGGGGGNDRRFDFNLAGTSRENQLADTLQGRFNQPLQAYVVSRDITNQQQLDQEILSSSSFG